MKRHSLLLSVLFATARLGAGPSDGYVAHEWGTFTSVQGSDGIQLEWNPLNVSELPKFVHLRHRLAGGTAVQISKTAFTSRQRMETPVVYFYADQAQKVDVTVDFPSGTITEWFPQIRTRPAIPGNPDPLVRASAARWDGVRILPPATPGQTPPALPQDPSGSHYYAARETDANLLQVETPGASLQTEKFLFYRGVADFTAPLRVTLGGPDNDELRLESAPGEELRHLFVYQVRGGQARFQYIDRLAAKANRSVRLGTTRTDRRGLPMASTTSVIAGPLAEVRQALAERLQTALVAEGLFPREATAMVKTWDDSWFGETGIRVLYVLPRAWTDRILPLRLEPAPKDLVRVMVGRAEVITPEMEWALLKEIARYCGGTDADRALAVDRVRELGMGRFTDAVIRRLSGVLPRTREFSTQAWQLLEAVSKPASERPVASVTP